MARLEERWPPGILAHLIGGTWCLLCVAGQVGQPEGLQPSWTPASLFFSLASAGAVVSLWEAHPPSPVKFCREAQPSEAWDRWLRIEANAGWHLVPSRQGQTLGRTSWDPVLASRPRPGLSSSWAEYGEKAVAELRSCHFPGNSQPASLLGSPLLSPFLLLCWERFRGWHTHSLFSSSNTP